MADRQSTDTFNTTLRFSYLSIHEEEIRGNGKIRNLPEHPLMFLTYIMLCKGISISVDVFSRNKTVKKSFILNIYLIRSSKSIIGLWSMYIYLSVCVLSFEYALCR